MKLKQNLIRIKFRQNSILIKFVWTNKILCQILLIPVPSRVSPSRRTSESPPDPAPWYSVACHAAWDPRDGCAAVGLTTDVLPGRRPYPLLTQSRYETALATVHCHRSDQQSESKWISSKCGASEDDTAFGWNWSPVTKYKVSWMITNDA